MQCELQRVGTRAEAAGTRRNVGERRGEAALRDGVVRRAHSRAAGCKHPRPVCGLEGLSTSPLPKPRETPTFSEAFGFGVDQEGVSLRDPHSRAPGRGSGTCLAHSRPQSRESAESFRPAELGRGGAGLRTDPPPLFFPARTPDPLGFSREPYRL